MIMALFRTSQCSWCRKFYTNEPFLCPPQRLQSNCHFFDRLSEAEGWWWREYKGDEHLPRIVDMMQQVENKGIMARCRDSECGALNPNSQKTTCWKCGKHTLCCPQHPDLILKYNIGGDYWECLLASHKQKFYRVTEPTLTEIPCPKCSKNLAAEGPNLYYDIHSLLLRCNNCHRFFKYHKSKLKEVKFKT